MAQIHIRLGDDAAARRLLREAFTEVRRSGGTSVLLFCVLAEADRRLTNGDESRGLELIGLVQSHPAHTSDNADEIDRILGHAGLARRHRRRGAGTRGVGLDFATVVDGLIDELATDADT